jgi:hypothetical protein
MNEKLPDMTPCGMLQDVTASHTKMQEKDKANI